MSDPQDHKTYNYDSFIPEKFEPLMRFNESPPLGEPGPNFPLWNLEDRSETTLHDVVKKNVYTVVEFGSFT